MNNFFNKQSLLIASVLLIIITFVSCNTSEVSPSDSGTTQPTNTNINETVNVTLNSIDIKDYVIIYSESDLDFNFNAAKYIKDSIKNAIGADIEMKIDTETAESEHEILVGYTNRTESAEAAKTELETRQFVISASNSKIVLYGREYAVAGAAYEFGKNIAESIGSNNGEITILETAEPMSPEYEDPDNIILFICTGVGENSLKFGEILYEKGIYSIAEKHIYPYNNLVDNLPNQGECYNRPYDVNHETDSAAAATALATGYKTYNGIIGLNKYFQPVKNLTELASELEKMTAVLTTDNIYSPVASAFSAHSHGVVKNADIEEVLEQQQTGDIDVILSNIRTPEISVPETLATLSESENGFFMMYEESRIDKSVFLNSSKNVFYSGYTEAMTVLRLFEEYIMYHPNTALIFTSDVEAGCLSFNESSGMYNIVDASHSTINVPLAGIGKGTEAIDGKICDNTFVAKLIAHLMGVDDFGDPEISETVEFSEAQPYTEEEKAEIKATQSSNLNNYKKLVNEQKQAAIKDREQRREEYQKSTSN